MIALALREPRRRERHDEQRDGERLVARVAEDVREHRVRRLDRLIEREVRIVARVEQRGANEPPRLRERHPPPEHDERRHGRERGADPPVGLIPREHRREAEPEDAEREDVRIKEREGERRDERAALPRRTLEIRDRLGEPPEHERDAEQKRQEAEHEHHVDEQRHDEETQPLVFAERVQERAERQHRPAQVHADEEHVRRLDADEVRKRAAEEVVDDVLRAPEREDEVLIEAVLSRVKVVDDPDRREMKWQIHHRRVFDDPRGSRREHCDGDVEDRLRRRPVCQAHGGTLSDRPF